MEIRLGEKIAGYIFGSKRGSGEFGSVYEATDFANKKCAVKVIEGDLLRVLEERDILKMLSNHKNITQIYKFHYVQDEEVTFIAMELVDSDLNELMKKQIHHEKKKLTPYEKFMIIKYTLIGLDHIHGYGIIHRDLKPENILISEKQFGPEVKISDFGLSKYFPYEADYEAGTYPYIAPEIIEGREVDSKCDIYSLGVVMEKLFEEHFWGNNLEGLVQIIQKAKAYNPKNRFQGCKEMLHYLHTIAETDEIRELIEPKQEPQQIPEEAIEHFLRIRNNWRTKKTKIKQYHKLIDSFLPFLHPHCHFELGRIHLAKGNFTKAVESFKETYYDLGNQKLAPVIAYCYSHIEKKETEAEYFIEKHNSLSEEQINSDSDLRSIIKKSLKEVSKNNERNLKERGLYNQ